MSQTKLFDKPFNLNALHSFGVAISISILLLVYAVLIYGNYVTGQTATWLTDMAWTLASLAASLRCWVSARRLPSGTQRRAWYFFSAAAFSWFLGMLIWNYYELILKTTYPYPSIADYFLWALPRSS